MRSYESLQRSNLLYNQDLNLLLTKFFLQYINLPVIWLSGNNSVVECDLAKVEVAGSNPVSRSS